MSNNLWLVLLLLLIVCLTHFIKQYQTEPFSTSFDQSSTTHENIKFQKIIENWNCNNSNKAHNVITNSEQFTINLKLKLNEILNNNINYCIFTVVDNKNCCGFPNLWIKNNNLCIKTQNDKSYKTLKYPLNQNIEYDIYLTYNNNLLQIRLYNNNQFSNFIFTNVKYSKGTNIHIGKIGNNRIDAIVSIYYLPNNLNIVDITNIVNNTIKCGDDNNLSKSVINNFKMITNSSNCQQTSFFPSVLDKTNQFTISTIMDVIDYNDTFEYQRLFNGSNNDDSQKIQGVWINQGYLHIRVSEKNPNDGTSCWKIEPILQKGVHYHMIIVYDQNMITVYINENLIVRCPTDGTVNFYPNLYVGKSKLEKKGANINLSIAYLPQALDKETVKKEWMEIRNIHYSKKFKAPTLYSPFKIDCAGNDIQPYFNIDLDQCKEHCTKNEKCKGVSYEPKGRTCVTKHTNCQCPGKDQNGFVYHRKGAETCDVDNNQQYVPFKMDCAGNDIQAFFNVSLDQCKEHCNQNSRCSGVSYEPKGRTCVTKHTSCQCPGKDQNGYIYYRKGSEPCDINQTNKYAEFEKDCPGNDILMLNNVNIDECQKKCDQNPNCTGYNYNKNIRRCFIKNKNCPCPGTVENGYVYYRKGSEPCQINKNPITRKFKIIVNKINCQQPKSFQSVMESNKEFTISAILDIVNYNDNFEYQRLFNGGSNTTWPRTPGVWINQGYLHIRATSDRNINDGNGCWKVIPQLKKQTKYHLILVYARNSISVYLDNKLIVNCPTSGNVIFYPDLHIGKEPHEKGADINMSIAYSPVALDNNTVINNWDEIAKLHNNNN